MKRRNVEKINIEKGHMHIQFNAGLGARAKQAKTIAIQYRTDSLNKWYYDDVINVMEYIDGLSLTGAKWK